MGGFRLAHATILARVAGLRKNIVTLLRPLARDGSPRTQPHPMKCLRENRSLRWSDKLDHRCCHNFSFCSLIGEVAMPAGNKIYTVTPLKLARSSASSQSNVVLFSGFRASLVQFSMK
jgi:hypothetical protein